MIIDEEEIQSKLEMEMEQESKVIKDAIVARSNGDAYSSSVVPECGRGTIRNENDMNEEESASKKRTTRAKRNANVSVEAFSNIESLSEQRVEEAVEEYVRPTRGRRQVVKDDVETSASSNTRSTRGKLKVDVDVKRSTRSRR